MLASAHGQELLLYVQKCTDILNVYSVAYNTAGEFHFLSKRGQCRLLSLVAVEMHF